MSNPLPVEDCLRMLRLISKWMEIEATVVHVLGKYPRPIVGLGYAEFPGVLHSYFLVTTGGTLLSELSNGEDHSYLATHLKLIKGTSTVRCTGYVLRCDQILLGYTGLRRKDAQAVLWNLAERLSLIHDFATAKSQGMSRT